MNNKFKTSLGFFSLMGLLFLSFFLDGCATTPPAMVLMSKDYLNAQPKRVALLGFRDYPTVEGSGEIAAGIFEKYLLLGEYSLVERRQVSEIMQEQALQNTDAIDPATLKKIGSLLGVDALVFGTVDDCTTPGEKTVMVVMPQEQTSPVYGETETIQRKGDTVVKTTQPVVSGFSTSFSSSIVPEQERIPAHVGISVRLVDVQTGAILWSASGSSEGSFLNDAMEKVSEKVMKAVEKQITGREGA